MTTIRYYGRVVTGKDTAESVEAAIKVAKGELRTEPRSNDHALIFDGGQHVATVITRPLKTITAGRSPYRIEVHRNNL